MQQKNRFCMIEIILLLERKTQFVGIINLFVDMLFYYYFHDTILTTGATRSSPLVLVQNGSIVCSFSLLDNIPSFHGYHIYI